jgi:hypothetical protein
MHNIHIQGKTTTPYTGEEKARGKMITTTMGLHTENNTQTPRPLHYKKSIERDNEIHHLGTWTEPLAEV